MTALSNFHSLALHQQGTSAGDLSPPTAAPTLLATDSTPASIQTVQPSIPGHTVPVEAPASVAGSIAATAVSLDARVCLSLSLAFWAPVITSAWKRWMAVGAACIMLNASVHALTLLSAL